MTGHAARSLGLLLCLSFAVHIESRAGVHFQSLIAAESSDGKTPPLVPRKGASSFKVLQLADLHLGEFFGSDKGTMQDSETLKAVTSLLDEEKPDLVVFSGDQLTGEGLPKTADRNSLLDKLEEPLQKRNIPWATIFGNHDGCDTSDCLQRVSKLSLAAAPKEPPTKADKAWSNTTDCIGGHVDDIFHLPSDTEVSPNPCAKKNAHAKAAKDAAAATVDDESAKARTVKAPDKKVAEKVAVKTGETAKQADHSKQSGSDTKKGADGNATITEEGGKSPALKAERTSKTPVVESDPSMIIFNALESQDDNSWRDEYLKHELAEKLSRTGTDGIFKSKGGGLTNYHLKVFASDEDAKADKPSYILWFVDTGGGKRPEGLQADQVEWLSKEAESLEAKYGPLPGALYAHIPLQEYAHVDPRSSVCTGIHDDNINQAGPRLVSLLSKMRVNFVFAGHNHGNDWCCKVKADGASSFAAKGAPQDIKLCHGRHSGHGGYSTGGIHLRGARILEIRPSFAKSFLRGQASEMGAKTWIRLEDGSKDASWSEKHIPHDLYHTVA